MLIYYAFGLFLLLMFFIYMQTRKASVLVAVNGLKFWAEKIRFELSYLSKTIGENWISDLDILTLHNSFSEFSGS